MESEMGGSDEEGGELRINVEMEWKVLVIVSLVLVDVAFLTALLGMTVALSIVIV